MYDNNTNVNEAIHQTPRDQTGLSHCSLASVEFQPYLEEYTCLPVYFLPNLLTQPNEEATL